MTGLPERRAASALVEEIDLPGVRRACGVTQGTMAAALGVSLTTVSFMERRLRSPSAAYCRVIAGLARHLAVTWDEDGGEPS